MFNVENHDLSDSEGDGSPNGEDLKFEVGSSVEGQLAANSLDEKDEEAAQQEANEIDAELMRAAAPEGASSEGPGDAANAPAAPPAAASSGWLAQVSAHLVSNQQRISTHREMMMGLVTVRQEHDTSKCECFDPAQLSAISKGVMDKRHRTIVLDAGDGNKMEVGTALRNKRMQKENSSMQTKMKSRLARWSTVSKVTSAVATRLSTTGFLKQGDIFMVQCHQ